MLSILPPLLLSLLCATGACCPPPPSAADPEFLRKVEESELYFPRQQGGFGFRDRLKKTDLSHRDIGLLILVEAHYPADLGHPAADETVEALALEMCGEGENRLRETALDYAEDLLCLDSQGRTDWGAVPEADGILPPIPACPGGRAWFYRTFYSVITYEAFLPSSDIVSLRFQRTGYSGGAHEMWRYRCITLNRATGAELDIDDVFPDTEHSLPLLEQAVDDGIRRLRQEGGYPFENVPGLTSYADLNMDRINLVPQGLRVTYGPYEQASFMEGDFEVLVPLAEALRLGARPELWSR